MRSDHSRSPRHFLDLKLSFVRLFLGLLAVSVVSGCSGGTEGDADRPARTLVSGKVTYDGNSVEGATVVLVPSSQGGKPATGLTDASGMFKLRTFETDDGALPGEYKVTVTKLKSAAENQVAEDDPNYEPPAEDGSDEDGSDGEPEHLLPEKYASAESSGLTASIPSEGEVNDLNFDLVD